MGFSCFGYLSADSFIAKFDVVKALMISYFISAILLIAIITFGPDTNIMLYAFLFFVLKTSICMGYSAIFVAHIDLFDPRMLATSMGISGVFARSALMLVPIYAELENRQYPLLILLTFNILAVVACFFMKKNTPK